MQIHDVHLNFFLQTFFVFLSDDKCHVKLLIILNGSGAPGDHKCRHVFTLKQNSLLDISL